MEAKEEITSSKWEMEEIWTITRCMKDREKAIQKEMDFFSKYPTNKNLEYIDYLKEKLRQTQRIIDKLDKVY